MNTLNNLLNTPEFSQYTEPQNCVLLSHEDCSLCGHVMNNGPYGIASIPVCCQHPQSLRKCNFVFYHTVCESCFEMIGYELGAVPTTNTPNWSLMRSFFEDNDGRTPLYQTEINDADATFDMLRYNFTTFDSWVDFDDAAMGAFDMFAFANNI